MKKLSKKEKTIFILITIIIFIIGIIIGSLLGQNKKNIKHQEVAYAYTITTENTKNCNKKPQLYYSYINKNIYTYCLDSIKIHDGKTLIELKNYFKERPNVLTEIINTMTFIDTYKDGGSRLYRDNGKTHFTNKGLTILNCKTEEENEDIYIGPKSMNYEENFCKNNPNFIKYDTFIKTYKVLNVAESNDDKYLYITVRQFQDEEIETVKIFRSLMPEIKENKNYEFKFQYTENKIEDNLKSIFEDAKLLSIKETDKIGLEQIQDSIK